MLYTHAMLGSFNINGRPIRVDFSLGESLAIPLNPHGEQPSFFVSDKATAEPLRQGEYIGSIRAGGSCNAEVIRFVPHSHGTHTECVGHILETADTVQQVIDKQPGLARVISITGTSPEDNPDEYQQDGERLVCRDEIQSQLKSCDINDYHALIIRSLPNDPGKTSRNYAEQPHYPVLSRQAVQWLAASKLLHLLIDMPSLDKADDHGKLANHRAWWGLDGNRADVSSGAAGRSVTEMIFVPDQVEDGEYWLELQLSPIMSDACASRPVIYPLVK